MQHATHENAAKGIGEEHARQSTDLCRALQWSQWSRGSSGGAAGLPDAPVAQFTAGSVSKEQFIEILIDHIYPAELAEVVSLSTSTGRPQLDEGDQETTTVTTSRSSRRQV